MYAIHFISGKENNHSEWVLSPDDGGMLWDTFGRDIKEEMHHIRWYRKRHNSRVWIRLREAFIWGTNKQKLHLITTYSWIRCMEKITISFHQIWWADNGVLWLWDRVKQFQWATCVMVPGADSGPFVLGLRSALQKLGDFPQKKEQCQVAKCQDDSLCTTHSLQEDTSSWIGKDEAGVHINPAVLDPREQDLPCY